MGIVQAYDDDDDDEDDNDDDDTGIHILDRNDLEQEINML